MAHFEKLSFCRRGFIKGYLIMQISTETVDNLSTEKVLQLKKYT